MIRIFNKNIIPIAEIDDFQSYIFERSFYQIGSFELYLTMKKQYYNIFKEDYFIMFENDPKKVGIIKNIEIDTNEDDLEILKITGPSLKAIMQKRIILPNNNEDYDYQSGNQELIMKNFVSNNFINTADSRKIDNLYITENKNLGINDKWRSRFENVSNKLEEIGKYAELGWDVYLNFKEKKFVFDVIKGRNLTNKVIFSRDFENISNETYLQAAKDKKNVIYAENTNSGFVQVYGKGDGINREEVYEPFHANNINDLEKLALRKLKDYDTLISLDSEYRESNSFIYKKDFDLGDYITFRNPDWNLILKTQITKITETIEKGIKYIDMEYGDNIPTILDKVSDNMNIDHLSNNINRWNTLNLIENSSFINGLEGWEANQSAILNIENMAALVVFNQVNSTPGIRQKDKKTYLENSKEYTLSFDIFNSNPKNIITAYLFPQSGETVIAGKFSNLNPTWTRVKSTFNIHSSQHYQLMILANSPYSKEDYMMIRQIQLEEGANANTWRPKVK